MGGQRFRKKSLDFSKTIYLLTSFGASEAYAPGAQMLSEALGFSVSATAVQRNTEALAVGNIDEEFR